MGSDVVFLCVTGTPEVESVVHRRDGLLEGAHDGLIVIDCSTSEPSSSERIASDLRERGASLVDAPLARTPVEAEAGRLNTMVGAAQEDFARVRPLLEACCENIFHMGPVGAGTPDQARSSNLITMGQAALIAEALCACAATGVDLKQVLRRRVSAGGGEQRHLPDDRADDRSSQGGLRRHRSSAWRTPSQGSPLLQPHGGWTVPLVRADGPERCTQALGAGPSTLGYGDGLVGALVARPGKDSTGSGFVDPGLIVRAGGVRIRWRPAKAARGAQERTGNGRSHREKPAKTNDIGWQTTIARERKCP